ncbi:M50 family metallopeptidase, partial [Bradyrhizobium sp. 143]|nr:M50 family metallopeptidase [Bradyrhizobium sp. 143]MCK1730528.1 M50 family metallopeptidase [Bradyrhizobium sp. 142]
MEAAAGVGGTTDNGGGLDGEIDQYDELLASLGRTYDEDVRIAVHETGHAVCARLLGREVGGMTVNPNPVRGYEGLCWGVGHTEAFAEGRGDAS